MRPLPAGLACPCPLLTGLRRRFPWVPLCTHVCTCSPAERTGRRRGCCMEWAEHWLHHTVSRPCLRIAWESGSCTTPWCPESCRGNAAAILLSSPFCHGQCLYSARVSFQVGEGNKCNAGHLLQPDTGGKSPLTLFQSSQSAHPSGLVHPFPATVSVLPVLPFTPWAAASSWEYQAVAGGAADALVGLMWWLSWPQSVVSLFCNGEAALSSLSSDMCARVPSCLSQRGSLGSGH